MAKRPRTDAQRDAEAKYEKARKREDVPVTVRLSIADAKLMDDARGDQTRAAWIKALVKKAVKANR